MLRTLLLAATLVALSLTVSAADDPAKKADPIKTLPGTKPLTMTGDIASDLVAGVDKFLLREIEAAGKNRERFFKRDYTSVRGWTDALEPNRKRLAHILGVRESRVTFLSPELMGTVDEPALVGRGANYNIFAVRWPAFADVHGEGLLLVPAKGQPVADVIAVPDADVTPEQLAGLTPGVKPLPSTPADLPRAAVGCSSQR